MVGISSRLDRSCTNKVRFNACEKDWGCMTDQLIKREQVTSLFSNWVSSDK